MRIKLYKECLKQKDCLILDKIGAGIILLDNSLKILHYNETIKEIIPHGKTIKNFLKEVVKKIKEEEKRRGGIKNQFIDFQVFLWNISIKVSPFLFSRKKFYFITISRIEPTYNDLQKSLRKWYPLTQKEIKVLREVIRGLSDKDIAMYFKISPATVRTHLRHIYSKLGVSSRLELYNQIKNIIGI